MVRVEIIRESAGFATVKYAGKEYKVWSEHLVQRHACRDKYCAMINYDTLVAGI